MFIKEHLIWNAALFLNSNHFIVEYADHPPLHLAHCDSQQLHICDSLSDGSSVSVLSPVTDIDNFEQMGNSPTQEVFDWDLTDLDLFELEFMSPYMDNNTGANAKLINGLDSSTAAPSPAPAPVSRNLSKRKHKRRPKGTKKPRLKREYDSMMGHFFVPIRAWEEKKKRQKIERLTQRSRQ